MKASAAMLGVLVLAGIWEHPTLDLEQHSYYIQAILYLTAAAFFARVVIAIAPRPTNRNGEIAARWYAITWGILHRLSNWPAVKPERPSGNGGSGASPIIAKKESG